MTVESSTNPRCDSNLFARLSKYDVLDDHSSVVVSLLTVLPAKSDSYVMFCLQSYQGLRMDRSLMYKSYPRINTQSDISIRISSSGVNALMFYLPIVNKK